MKTTWFIGLKNKTEKEEMRNLFLSNARFRNQAKKIFESKIESIRNRNTLEDAYDNPNWALKQADAVGYERAFKEMLSLFE